MPYTAVRAAGTLIAVIRFAAGVVEVWANQDGSTTWKKAEGAAADLIPFYGDVKIIWAVGKKLIEIIPNDPGKNSPEQNVREMEEKNKRPPEDELSDPQVTVEDELKRQFKDSGITYVPVDYDYTYKPRSQVVADIEAGQTVTTAKTGFNWLPLLLIGLTLSQ